MFSNREKDTQKLSDYNLLSTVHIKILLMVERGTINNFAMQTWGMFTLCWQGGRRYNEDLTLGSGSGDQAEDNVTKM